MLHVKLTDYLVLRLDTIKKVSRWLDYEGGSKITTDDGETYHLKESVEEVFEKMKEASK